MLTQLQIKDFAIIDAVEIEFDEGLTVLTGETGAGKSILVDALGFLLGDRADTGSIRHGADQASVTASFDCPAPAVAAWLAATDCDTDEECVVRRVIRANGRSRAYINGASVSRAQLRELGARLMDIHGQHAHQSLLNHAEQRRIVDAHGGHAGLLKTTADAYAVWADLDAEAARLATAASERDARLDILRYQVREFEELDFGADEAEQLEREQARLANVEKLADGVTSARAAVIDGPTDNGDGAQTLVARASSVLTQLAAVDPELAGIAQLLEQADIHLQEAAADITAYAADLELDPARLNEIESRLAAAQGLARKHRIGVAELPARTAALKSELAELDTLELRLEGLSGELAAAHEVYVAAAAKLSRARRRSAKRLATSIQAGIATLGMPNGRFEIAVDTPADLPVREHGTDTIEFLVSANAGQPPGALGKVASGGELARIGLAIQVVAAGLSKVPSMVFDEVDTGVGGGIAEMVGQQLRELGRHCQVLCVTHLPQVASQAHQHLRVNKLSDGKTTRTGIAALTDKEVVEELARMLGGVQITRKTREHAAEMVARARSAG